MFKKEHVERSGVPSEATKNNPLYIHNAAQRMLMKAWAAQGGDVVGWADAYGARFSALEAERPELIQSLIDGTVAPETIQQQLETLH